MPQHAGYSGSHTNVYVSVFPKELVTKTVWEMWCPGNSCQLQWYLNLSCVLRFDLSLKIGGVDSSKPISFWQH